MNQISCHMELLFGLGSSISGYHFFVFFLFLGNHQLQRSSTTTTTTAEVIHCDGHPPIAKDVINCDRHLPVANDVIYRNGHSLRLSSITTDILEAEV